jgi:hypothetical protein
MAVLLAVNGTLMRGLSLNGNLLRVGARFVFATTTAPVYRLWSIDDQYPAMVRVTSGGASIALEVWELPASALATILLDEPPGLAIGRVMLSSGEAILGVLGEAAVCEGKKEITHWGGWRAYMIAKEGGDEPHD